MSFVPFEILYEDEHLVAINKPPGILVHRSRLSEDTVFVLQLLRDQIGQRLFPAHRLDRGTSGVLLFGKTAESASALGAQFMDKSLNKKYIALIRGHVPEQDTIDYPLADEESGKGFVPAITHYKRLREITRDMAIGLRYPTARFSLVEIEPETGRRHQIRKHFAHLRHPVIGDPRHGDVKQNKYFREQFGITRLLLHAQQLTIRHPLSGESMTLDAAPDAEFLKALDIVFGDADLADAADQN
ncbi:MAG TPA: pseudouridine synthase [Saprospiraceae bacterium]|nr:pseudouridine synthase [Saprospiraceae bacterium]HPI08146.1 pseudouridine synthase [Saprospiraceae bacterium]